MPTGTCMHICNAGHDKDASRSSSLKTVFGESTATCICICNAGHDKDASRSPSLDTLTLILQPSTIESNSTMDLKWVLRPNETPLCSIPPVSQPPPGRLSQSQSSFPHHRKAPANSSKPNIRATHVSLFAPAYSR